MRIVSAFLLIFGLGPVLTAAEAVDLQALLAEHRAVVASTTPDSTAADTTTEVSQGLELDFLDTLAKADEAVIGRYLMVVMNQKAEAAIHLASAINDPATQKLCQEQAAALLAQIKAIRAHLHGER